MRPGGPGPGWAPLPPRSPGCDICGLFSSWFLLKLSCIFLVMEDLMCNPHIWHYAFNLGALMYQHKFCLVIFHSHALKWLIFFYFASLSTASLLCAAPAFSRIVAARCLLHGRSQADRQDCCGPASEARVVLLDDDIWLTGDRESKLQPHVNCKLLQS